MSLQRTLDYVDAELPHSVARLQELLRIPSISTDPAYSADCARAAEHMSSLLNDLGFSASVRPTTGHPMVVAHGGGGGDASHDDSAPHLLFYGHYDVQPVDPIDLWDHDPFDPVIEDGPAGRTIRARGASDDKGQLMTFIEACRAWKATHGSLPCKLTIFLEGEEESGSPSLIPFMQQNADELRADLALICDTGLFASKTPAIVTMLRGLLGEDIIVQGPHKDLHSGMFGGAAINPLRVLTQILGTLHDAQGRITVPHFYDGVDELPNAIRAQWQALGFDHSAFLGGVGLSQPAGEEGRSVLEMLWSRPTAEINGIIGGYTGDGFKTVLPAEARAKVSFRLVGQQDPHAIRTNFRAWVRAQLPADCSVRFEDHGASEAGIMAYDSPEFEMVRGALSAEWGEEAAYVGCGGSIPIAGYFKTYLGMNALLTGFARDDDQIHSPNEKYDLECFHKGIRSWVRVLDRFAAQ